MQNARVPYASMGLVCESPSNTNAACQVTKSPLSATTSPQSDLISPPSRNTGRRRSTRNSVHNFLSSMIQYATEITTDQPANVQFEKRGVNRNPTTECPPQSLLSEMLRRQMVGGGGNCAASSVTRTRGIRFDCGLTTMTKPHSLTNTAITRNVKPCLKFGPRQDKNVEEKPKDSCIALSTATLSTKLEITDPSNELQRDKLPTVPSKFNCAPATSVKKIKHLSSPPVKSYLNRKIIQQEDEEDQDDDQEEDEDEDEDEDEYEDEEDGYMEDDEDEDDFEEEEESLDNDETAVVSNRVYSASQGTQSIPKSAATTGCLSQEPITASPSSHYSTAFSLLSSPAPASRKIHKSKSFSYSCYTSSDETVITTDPYPGKIPIRRQSRKVHAVKSIPIPKTYNSNHYHEPHHAHKRRHQKGIERGGEDALWIDIISARRMRMVAGGAGTNDTRVCEEDILWPLSI